MASPLSNSEVLVKAAQILNQVMLGLEPLARNESGDISDIDIQYVVFRSVMSTLEGLSAEDTNRVMNQVSELIRNDEV